MIKIRQKLETNDLIPVDWIEVEKVQTDYSIDITGRLYDNDYNLVNWVVINLYGEQIEEFDGDEVAFFINFYKLELE